MGCFSRIDILLSQNSFHAKKPDINKILFMYFQDFHAQFISRVKSALHQTKNPNGFNIKL